MRTLLLSLFAWLALAATAQHAPYNYVAEAPGIVSMENGQPHEGFLWIAPGAERVEALMFAFQNMNEETLFSMPAFRERMGAAGVALLWIAPGFGRSGTSIRACRTLSTVFCAISPKQAATPSLPKYP